MTGILKVDQWKDSGDNALMTSDGAGNLTANVNLGINTSSPSSQLHIVGSNATTQFKIEHSSASNAVLIGEDSSSNLRIYTSGVERIRVDSDGHAIIPQGVTLGTAAGTYNANNTLDDYEEGTWTPSFEFSAAQPTAGNTTGTGFYTKVGNMVTVWGAVTNANVTGGSGDVRIRDLPFTSKASANLVGWHGTMSVAQMTFSGYVNCDIQDGFSYIRPIENISGVNRDILNVANCIDGATDVLFCINYQVN